MKTTHPVHDESRSPVPTNQKALIYSCYTSKFGYRLLLGTAGIIQLCNTARHNVVIIYVPIYHAFY